MMCAREMAALTRLQYAVAVATPMPSRVYTGGKITKIKFTGNPALRAQPGTFHRENRNAGGMDVRRI